MPDHSDLTQEAKARVAEIADEAQDALHREASNKVAQARDAAAGNVQDAADAASAAAAKLDPGSMQAEAVRHIADRIESVARRIRASDMDTLLRDTSDLARRNPLLFVGAAATIGFVATRFLKAQPNDRSGASHPGDDPWTENITSRGAVPANDHHRSVLSKMNGGRNV